MNASIRIVGFALPLLVLAHRAGAQTVVVDWGKPTGRQATARQFGLNLFQGPRPDVAGTPGNASYKSGLVMMQPGLVRLHHAGLIQDSKTSSGWVVNPSGADYHWDEQKIRAALTGHPLRGAVWIMDITRWPAFLGPGTQPLAAAQIPAFTAFAAALVQIVNVNLKFGVRYFEVLNENEAVYKDKPAAWAALVVAASVAMKAVDPTIKVGGPGFANPWGASVEPFIKAAAADLDFISYHTYSTGDQKGTPDDLFNSAAGLGGIAGRIRGFIAKATTRPVEIFHDEYNISYAPPDPRMTNGVGAVFDALAMMSFVNADVSGACAWNEADGWYGKLDSSFRPRPAAHVFRLFNAFVPGAVMSAVSTAPNEVSALATVKEGQLSLVLVNRVAEARSVKVSFAAKTPNGPGWKSYQVSRDGFSVTDLKEEAAGIGVGLPAQSVTVLVAGGVPLAVALPPPAAPPSAEAPAPPAGPPSAEAPAPIAPDEIGSAPSPRSETVTGKMPAVGHPARAEGAAGGCDVGSARPHRCWSGLLILGIFALFASRRR